MDCIMCNGNPEETKEECTYCGKREELLLSALAEEHEPQPEVVEGE